MKVKPRTGGGCDMYKKPVWILAHDRSASARQRGNTSKSTRTWKAVKPAVSKLKRNMIRTRTQRKIIKQTRAPLQVNTKVLLKGNLTFALRGVAVPRRREARDLTSLFPFSPRLPDSPQPGMTCLRVLQSRVLCIHLPVSI